jgi:hypothetical protein
MARATDADHEFEESAKRAALMLEGIVEKCGAFVATERGLRSPCDRRGRAPSYRTGPGHVKPRPAPHRWRRHRGYFHRLEPELAPGVAEVVCQVRALKYQRCSRFEDAKLLARRGNLDDGRVARHQHGVARRATTNEHPPSLPCRLHRGANSCSNGAGSHRPPIAERNIARVPCCRRSDVSARARSVARPRDQEPSSDRAQHPQRSRR